MKKSLAMSLVLGVCTLCAQGASGQTTEDTQPVTFPGSFWNVTGNMSPAEGGNVISASYVEQGIALFRAETLSFIPYVSLSQSVDSRGYDWNNRVLGTIGGKFVKRFDQGMISLSGGVAHAYHPQSGISATAPYLRADYWVGWGLSEKFPGNSWGMIGTVSPVERGNIIATAYIQQGVVAGRVSGVAVVPFVEATVMRDTSGYDWNNRNVYGAGVKIMNPNPSCGCEFGVMYQNERRTQSGAGADGISVFMKFWFGWNPVKQQSAH